MFQCRERLGDFGPEASQACRRLTSGFSRRERLEWDFYGYSSRDVAYYVAEFQCRERLEWDFYISPALPGVLVAPGLGFQCRERLEWDFYQEAIDEYVTFAELEAFQCRERLEWDFYE